MALPRLRLLPRPSSALLALVSALLLTFAYPDLDLSWLAWAAAVPLLWAIENEKERPLAAAIAGWLFGVGFFFGTCWWLAYAPIHYAGFPAIVAYFLVAAASAITAVFPAIFAALLAASLKKLGWIAVLGAPAVWTATEFLRWWVTGNNWNALGYSQAFTGHLKLASIGGVYLVGFEVAACNAAIFCLARFAFLARPGLSRNRAIAAACVLAAIPLAGALFPVKRAATPDAKAGARVVAIQPNVPMSGLDHDLWRRLRARHVRLTEDALSRAEGTGATTVIFPESPMNFMFDEDPEFRSFVGEFASRNNVSVLFNSAEPDHDDKKYFNSAVLVDTAGREVAQYDKIYLLPFGEAVPAPLQSIVPAFVGSFSYGKEYDLIPLGGGVNAGVMICFESHFGELSREYVRRGADVIIEMTNDGYLGPTPVLRQHLANAVFRAVETNRPVLRVTNVGITAYIDERGDVIDPAESYTEDWRVWKVSRSDAGQTFYVKYGDWFAWLCSVVTIAMLIWAGVRRQHLSSGITEN